MPDNMPTDEYLNTFEKNPYAGVALFWALRYNWQFSDYRTVTQEQLDVEWNDENSKLREGIVEDFEISDETIRLCHKEYYHSMNPTQPVNVCSCCGMADVSVTENVNDVFGEYRVNTFTAYPVHVENDSLNPLLNILMYQDDSIENIEDLPLPSHILNTPENVEKWRRYRVIKSLYLIEYQIDNPDIVDDDDFEGKNEVSIEDEILKANIIKPARISKRSLFYLYLETMFNDPVSLCLHFVLCGTCESSLKKNVIPKISIAGGEDIGMYERIENPPMNEPTFFEELLLQKVRVLSAALNINVSEPNQEGKYGVVRGHAICFLSDGAEVCGLVMPDLAFAKSSVAICVSGPRGCKSSVKLEGAIRNLGALKASAADILDWLYLLKFVHPLYYDIVILDVIETEKMIIELRDSLIAEREILTYKERDVEEVAKNVSDISHPPDVVENIDGEHDDGGKDGEHDDGGTEDLVEENFTSDANIHPESHFLTSRFEKRNNQYARKHILNTIRSSVGDVATVEVSRESEPLNSYMDAQMILDGGFPFIFPLGTGSGTNNGPMSKNHRRFLLSHFCRRPCRNSRLLFYLHDLKQRADTARVMKAQVSMDDNNLRKFYNFVMDPANVVKLEQAQKNPESKEANALLRQILPFVNITGGKIPFSPFERGQRCTSELFALCRMYDLPNLFITIGFDERRNVVTAKISCTGYNGIPRNEAMSTPNTSASSDFWKIPSDQCNFSEFSRRLPGNLPVIPEAVTIWQEEIAGIISKDPVAVALIGYRMLQAFSSTLLGVKLTDKKTFANFESQTGGLFGLPKAYFWVHELTGRNILHFHALYWVGLPPWLTQRLAVSNEWSTLLTSMFKDIYNASITPELHACNLLRRHDNVKFPAAAFFTPPPLNSSTEEIRNLGMSVASVKQVHSHMLTCRKGTRGETMCRLCYGRATETSLKPRVITRRKKRESTGLIPHPSDVLPTLVVLSSEEFDNDNDMIYRLSVPGGSTVLLDYPIHRPVISVKDMRKNLDPKEVEQILLTQYTRLLHVCETLEISPTPIDSPRTNDGVYLAVCDTMKTLCLGAYESEGAILMDETLIDVINTLPNRDVFYDYLSQHNSLLSESNNIVNAMLGCSFNCQPLTSHEAALAAVFYIIDYMTKDSMLPSRLFGFVNAARERMFKYSGCIPEGEVPDEDDSRPLRRLAQVVQNGIAGSVEIGVQQCALNILGISAHGSSASYRFIFSGPAVRAVRAAFDKDPDRDFFDSIEEEEEEKKEQELEKDDFSHDGGDEKQKDVNIQEDLYTQIDAGLEMNINNAEGVGDTKRKIDGKVAVTSQHLEYIYRGPNLCWMSLAEYACLVQRSDEILDISPSGKDARFDKLFFFVSICNLCFQTKLNFLICHVGSRRRGRNSNYNYTFAEGYPLVANAYQKAKSVIETPKWGRYGSVPSWPDVTSQRQTIAKTIRAITNSKIKFAEWVLANVIPHPKVGHTWMMRNYSNHPLSCFFQILRQLEKGEFLRDVNNDFQGPPGYEDMIVMNPDNYRVGDPDRDTPDHNKIRDDFFGLQFSQMCLARFIGSIARGLRRPKDGSTQVHMAWRGRLSQRWDQIDPEKTLFPETWAKNQKMSYGKGEGVDDEGGSNDMSSLLAFAVELARRAHDVDDLEAGSFNAVDIRAKHYLNKFAKLSSLVTQNVDGSIHHALDAPEGIQRTYPRLGHLRHVTSSEIVDKRKDLKKYFPTISRDDMDCCDDNPICDILSAFSRDNESGRAQAALEDMCRKNPLLDQNVEQKALLQEYANAFDKDESVQTLKFLHSAGGTGKSFIIGCIEKLAFAVGKTICVTSLTGASATGIPLVGYPAVTFHSALQIPVHLSKFKALDKTIFVEKQNLIQHNTIILFVVDEIGFGTSKTFYLMDVRLRELMGNDELFGGVSVLVCGDLHQLEPIHPFAICKAAFNINKLGSMEKDGFQLFTQFRLHELKKQMRCVDFAHEKRLNDFRNSNTNGLKEYIKSHILTSENRDGFGPPTKFISPGNIERYHTEKSMLINWAQRCDDKIISWRLQAKVVGMNSNLHDALTETNNISDADFEKMIIDVNPQLQCHFVVGCPIVLNMNINPSIGLANGTKGTLCSLDWDTEEKRAEALRFIDDNSSRCVNLPDHLAPSIVCIKPILADNMIPRFPIELSLDPDHIVISVPCEREKIDLKLGHRRVTVSVNMPQYSIENCSTVHKMQGSTQERVIISLLKRHTFPHREDYNSIYVALSRVKNGDGLRFLADPNDVDFVEDLHPSNELVAFLIGYNRDTGLWNRGAAERKFEELQVKKDQGKKKLNQAKNNSASRSKHTTQTSVEKNLNEVKKDSVARSKHTTQTSVAPGNLTKETQQQHKDLDIQVSPGITNGALLLVNKMRWDTHDDMNNIFTDILELEVNKKMVEFIQDDLFVR
jgi:hypothetical protein